MAIVKRFTGGINQEKSAMLTKGKFEAVALGEDFTIDNILVKIINQEYSDSTLDIAKKIQTNALIESLDSNLGIVARITRDSLFNNKFNPEELIDNLKLITKDDVSQIAKILRKDTVFLLKGDDNE